MVQYGILLTATKNMPQDSTLTNIMDNTWNTALNTEFGIIALLSFIAALVSAFFAAGSFMIGWRTMKAQISTENSTKGGKNVPSTQSLMIDMVRHLYRNYVVTYAIRERMKEKKFMVYPSEIHLKKMRLNLDNIDLHIYLKKPEDYLTLSNLYLFIRNYHYELEVFTEHLKDKMLDISTKEKDLYSLLFKCEFLTENIIKTLVTIWPDSKRNFILEAKKAISDSQEYRQDETWLRTMAPMDSFTHYKGDNYSYYLRKLFVDSADTFIDRFNRDVAIELGKDSVGSYKITMIDV